MTAPPPQTKPALMTRPEPQSHHSKLTPGGNAGNRHCHRRPGVRDVGSVLALVPAAVLTLVLLGALAVDSAATYLAQQELHDALVAAANDAASAGLDLAAFYEKGTITLSAPATAAAACESFTAQKQSQLYDVQLWIAVSGSRLRLVGTARVDAVFGRSVPGFASRKVRASVEAVAATSEKSAVSASQAPVDLSRLVPLSCPS